MRTVASSLLAVALAAPVLADVVNLAPARDTSLYETCSPACPDTGANGAGAFLFSGMTNGFGARRALLHFDLATIPAGSTVNSVTLTLDTTYPFGSNMTGAPTLTLHRVLADWGTGASDAGTPGGDGTAPLAGDASWNHRFFPGDLWTAPGGDFDAAVSAGQVVDPAGPVSWSGPGLVADVQAWVDGSASNFGWIVVGDESTVQTAKRFFSSEGTTPPELVIDFTPSAVPAASEWGLIALATLLVVGGGCVIRRRATFAH